jgi:Electron transfer DM13
MQKSFKISIIVAIVVIGGFLASPLFYQTQVNESLPTALNQLEPGLTYDKFVNMDEEKRLSIVEKMPDQVKDLVMKEAASSTTIVSESMDDLTKSKDVQTQMEPTILKTGQFEGLFGHQASGTAKIIKINNMTYLRFENFQVTNGPDLHVYITSDGNIQNGINLAKLKGSVGDQNYLLENINLGTYNTVVIYCQPFGVYFGHAKLN